MRKIQLTKQAKDEIVNTYLRHPADIKHGPTVINEDCVIYRPDGEILCIVKQKRDWDPVLRAALIDMKVATSTRLSGFNSTSQIVGFRPRDPRQNYCGLTRWTSEHPEEWEKLKAMARECDALYRKYMPTTYERHRQYMAEHMKPFWMIPGTLWTSGIVNKNNQLNYHFDRGNVENVGAMMITFLKGNVQGGELVLPKYGARIKYRDGDITIFNNQNLLHGVSPIEAPPGAERITFVLYSLENMGRCGTFEEEMARLKASESRKVRGEPEPEEGPEDTPVPDDTQKDQ